MHKRKRIDELQIMSEQRHDLVKNIMNIATLRLNDMVLAKDKSVPKGILDLIKCAHELQIKEELIYYEALEKDRLTMDKASTKILDSMRSLFIERYGLEETDRLLSEIKKGIV